MDLLKEPRAEQSNTVIREISVPQYLWDAMMLTMREAGYSQKMRSRWIEEAIAGLIVFDPLMLQSNYEVRTLAIQRNPEGEALDRTMFRTKTSLRYELDDRVQELAGELVRTDADHKGAYSRVIRIAIRGRLGRPSCFPSSPCRDGDILISKAVDADVQPPRDVMWNALDLVAIRLDEREKHLNRREAQMRTAVMRATALSRTCRYRALNGLISMRSVGPRVLIVDRAKMRSPTASKPFRPAPRYLETGRSFRNMHPGGDPD